jgi:hypothetical protein
MCCLRRLATREHARESVQETTVETIMIATDRLFATHDTGEMVRQARILGQATAQLIQAIKVSFATVGTTAIDSLPKHKQRSFV